MQRRATLFAGIAIVVLIVALVVRSLQGSRASEPSSSVSAPDAGATSATGSANGASSSATTGARADDASTGFLSDLVEPTPTVRDDAGGAGSMLDGAPVPPLPPDSPHQVRFGIVLVSYDGAQPSGGRPPSRSRAEAKALADKLLAGAHDDFHAAVQQGDPGSSDDVGRVKLGILEPAPEYVLFTLPVRGVGGPVDTPRGYWIVKRLE